MTSNRNTSSVFNYNRTFTSFSSLIDRCKSHASPWAWLSLDLCILIAALAANVALLWILLRDRKALSSSQYLSVNLALMGLLYLLLMPVRICDTFLLTQKTSSANTNKSLRLLGVVSEGISILKLIGCPLLLACMCMERYVAVTRPVLYLKLRRMKYRVVVSLVIWSLTFAGCMATVLGATLEKIMIYISAIISFLFLLMFSCLWGIVLSLWQQSPAHTSNAPHSKAKGQAPPPLKRHVVGNVLVVMVPTVVSYLPVILLLILLTLMCRRERSAPPWCKVVQWMQFFPNFGLFIGPTLYLAKARQILYVWVRGKGTDSR